MQGQGATNSNGFAQQTTAFLQQVYRTVAERNFGVGRTDSEFAAYRLEQDFKTFTPDLVFISFIDDFNDAARSASYFDALVYKLRRINPNVAIVFVATTQSTDRSDRIAGSVPLRVQKQQQLASEETVLFVDIGAALWQRAMSQGADNISAFLDRPTGGTPNDAGHGVYAEALRNYINPRLETLTGYGRTESRYIAQTQLQDATLRPVSAVETTSCAATTASEVYLTSTLTCAAGQSFTLRFTGRNVGLVRGMTAEGGTLNCTVNDALPQSIDFYEQGVPAGRLFGRPVLTYQNLTNGENVLRCTASATPPAGSTGTTVVIGGFLQSSGQLLTSY